MPMLRMIRLVSFAVGRPSRRASRSFVPAAGPLEGRALLSGYLWPSADTPIPPGDWDTGTDDGDDWGPGGLIPSADELPGLPSSIEDTITWETDDGPMWVGPVAGIDWMLPIGPNVDPEWPATDDGDDWGPEPR